MASMALPPMPMTPSGPQAGVGTLLGPSAAPVPGPVDMQEAVVGASRSIRDLIAGVEAISRQFPETSEFADEAKMRLVDMMQQIVGTQRGPESAVAPPPQVIG